MKFELIAQELRMMALRTSEHADFLSVLKCAVKIADSYSESKGDPDSIRPLKIRGTHPYSYRTGEWAEVVGTHVRNVKHCHPRPVYVCLFDDGVVDYIAIEDSANYEIG